MSNPQRVAIYDSGVGSLAILASVRERIGSQAEYVLLIDNFGFPYGTKSDEEVTRHALRCIGGLARDWNPDVIVMACNTASTVALGHCRAATGATIVGVVPAIKPAASTTRTKSIGLLATPATIARPYTAALIHEHAPHCHVVKVGSSQLVRLAEEKLRGRRIDGASVAQEIAPLFSAHEQGPVDVCVLGCTHFPLLIEELNAAAPRPMVWLDSGAAIASRTAALMPSPTSRPPSHHPGIALFTRDDAMSRELIPFLASHQFSLWGVLGESRPALRRM